jgi:hypothetical protein
VNVARVGSLYDEVISQIPGAKRNLNAILLALQFFYCFITSLLVEIEGMVLSAICCSVRQDCASQLWNDKDFGMYKK